MSAEFWQLPGPSNYVTKIHHDLADNHNVIAHLTINTPEGLLYELQGAVEQSGLAWRRLYEQAATTTPASWLAKQIGEKLGPIATAADFYSLPSIEGATFVIDDLPNDDVILEAWNKFLLQYAQTVRAANNMQSPRFLFLWPTVSSKTIFTDVRLNLYPWDDCLDSVDIHLYAAMFARKSGRSPFYRKLMTSLASTLSGGDPILCRDLCTRSLQELIEPLDTLRSYADERGWTDSTLLRVENGTLTWIDSAKKEHPALIAIQGRAKEISTLVWSAQLSVLMGLLEERRYEIVERMADRLHIPDNQDPRYMIHDISDMEIGTVCYQLQNNASHIPRTVTDQVQRLRWIRNELAHRRPLSAEYLLNEDTVRSLTKKN
jgi:hypothetical protein